MLVVTLVRARAQRGDKIVCEKPQQSAQSALRLYAFYHFTVHGAHGLAGRGESAETMGMAGSGLKRSRIPEAEPRKRSRLSSPKKPNRTRPKSIWDAWACANF